MNLEDRNKLPLGQVSLSVTAANWTTRRATASIVQLPTGQWLAYLNIGGGDTSGLSTITLTIAGIVFKAVPGTTSRQSLSAAHDGSNQGARCFTAPGASTITITTGGAAPSEWFCNGWVEIDEPTAFLE